MNLGGNNTTIYNALARIYDLYQGSEVCKNPLIEAKSLEGADVGCVKNGVIHVSIDPTKDYHCIEIYVTCANCPTCPPTRITECFCGSGLLCPPCHTCDPVTNRCIPLCPDKLCINQTCSDCDPNHPCPAGKVCNNNRCECAPGTYLNPLGVCVQCTTNAECPQCGECIGYSCRPKQCVGGYLDPINCLCVQCTDKSHCRPDQICDGGKCKCPPNTYLNPTTGLCTALPKCTDAAAHCPVCMDCILGTCQPKQCPNGSICVNGECVYPCDCNNKACPPGKGCVPIGGTCYCISCGNISCVPGQPCPIGCHCNDATKKCDFNPCNGPCSPDKPCAPNCGCDPLTHMCRPCSAYNCNQCKGIPGCTCPDGGNGICMGVAPCPAIPCKNGTECGPNCGCDKLTQTCKPCSTLSCNNCNQLDGCICNDLNNACIKNPCDSPCVPGGMPCNPGCACNVNTFMCEPCSKFSCDGVPCPTNCTCGPNKKCQPNVSAPNPTDCTDTFKIVALDDQCAAQAQAHLSKCCACPVITLQIDVTGKADSVNSRVYTYNLNLLKSGVLLSDTGVANAKPYAGKIATKMMVVYQEINYSGVPTGNTFTDYINETYDYANADTKTSTFGINGDFSPSGNMRWTNPADGKLYEFLAIRILAYTIETLKFDSGCIESMAESQIFYSTNLDSLIFMDGRKDFVGNVPCGAPIVSWYQDADLGDLFTAPTLIRKAYMKPAGNNNFTDNVTKADNLQPCKLLGAEPDGCTCAKRAMYSCHGAGGAPTPFVLKVPNDMNLRAENCGNRICFEEDLVVTCSVYTGASVRPTYQLIINGAVVSTKQLPANGILYAADECFDAPGGIAVNEVRLHQVCDSCNNDVVKNGTSFGLVDVIIIPPVCYDVSNDLIFRVSVNGLKSPATYTLKLNAGTISSGNITHTTQDITVPNDPGVYLLEVIDNDGCIFQRTYNYTPTNTSLADNVVFLQTVCINGVINVTIKNNLTVSVTFKDWPGTGGDFIVNPGVTVTKQLPTGNYPTIKIQSTDFPTCQVIKSINMDCCSPLPTEVSTFGVSYSCSARLILAATPGIVVKEGSTILVAGQSMTAGDHNITITNGICTENRVLTIPSCYKCQSGNCNDMGATADNSGYASAFLCGQSCDPCTGNALAASILNVPSGYCSDHLLKVSVAGGSAPYVFDVDGIAPTSANLVLGVYELDIALADGPHVLHVMDNNGCIRTYNFSINCCNGVSLGASDVVIGYVCDPIAPYVNVTFAGVAIGATIQKITGANGFTNDWNNPTQPTEVITLSPGTYTLHFTLSNGCQFTKTFVVAGCWKCDGTTYTCAQVQSGLNVGYQTESLCLGNCNSGNYTADYICGTGMVVNTSYFVKKGTQVWGPFADTDHRFFTDNTYLVYKNNNGALGELIATKVIQCCTAAAVTVTAGQCNSACPTGSQAQLNIALSGGTPTDSYIYEVLDTVTNDSYGSEAIVAGGPTMTAICIPEAKTVKVVITNLTYENRSYTNTTTPTCKVTSNVLQTAVCQTQNPCNVNAATVTGTVWLAQNCSGGNPATWKLLVNNATGSSVNVQIYIKEVDPGSNCSSQSYPGSPNHTITSLSTGGTACASFNNPAVGKEHCAKIVVTKVGDPTCTFTFYRGTEQ